VRGEHRVDQRLAFQQVVRRRVDAYDQLEAEDRLPQGAPNGLVHHLGTPATQAGLGTALRLPVQPIERGLRGIRLEERAHV